MSAPSPYRFTVSVRNSSFNPNWWVRLGWESAPNDEGDTEGWQWWKFPTEAEARSHAALVLAALHNAEMEPG